MRKRKKSGPTKERLKIEGEWEDAVEQALEAGPPTNEEIEPDNGDSSDDKTDNL